jgi:hypothetical protein
MTAIALRADDAAERRGRQLVTSAIDALGGAERLSSFDNWVIEGAGRENLSAELQGLAPGRPTWRPHEEKIAVAGQSVAWERRTPRNDQSLRWRRFICTPASFRVIDWTSRSGFVGSDPTSAATRLALERRVPHLLLLDVAQHATRIAARERSDAADVSLPDGVSLTLFFGRGPVVLTRAEYRIEMPGLGMRTIGWRWRDWKVHPTVGLAPSGHVIDVGGVVFQDVAYSRFTAGADDVPAFMEVPPEFRERRAAGETPPPPAVTGLAAQEMIAFATARFPGKPLRYVIISHPGDLQAVRAALCSRTGIRSEPFDAARSSPTARAGLK